VPCVKSVRHNKSGALNVIRNHADIRDKDGSMRDATAARRMSVQEGGLDIAGVERPGATRYFITAHADTTGGPHGMFERVGAFVASRKAAIAAQFVFGGCRYHEEGMAAIRRASGPVAWPVTWVQGDTCSGRHLSGTQVFAIAGVPVEPVEMGGAVVGTVYEDEYARYCLLGDVRPEDIAAPRVAQVQAAFEKITAALVVAGMELRHMVRTWIYLSKLLEWYGEFNAVRTRFLTTHHVLDGLVPASTGIGVRNPVGAALVTAAVALRPKGGAVTVAAVPSPLQCPALNYKSTFSRAAEIAYPDARLLLVSGTASITPDGATAHLGDTAGQIALTMEVVNAILVSRGMTWRDVTRAIAYFRNVRELPLLTEYCRANGLPSFPMALSHADICRDDLLFEIEADAFSTNAASGVASKK